MTFGIRSVRIETELEERFAAFRRPEQSRNSEISHMLLVCPNSWSIGWPANKRNPKFFSIRAEISNPGSGSSSSDKLPNISHGDKAFVKRVRAKYSSLRQTIFYQRVHYVFPYRFWLVISAEDYAEMSDTRVVREINNIVDDDAAKVRR